MKDGYPAKEGQLGRIPGPKTMCRIFTIGESGLMWSAHFTDSQPKRVRLAIQLGAFEPTEAPSTTHLAAALSEAVNVWAAEYPAFEIELRREAKAFMAALGFDLAGES